MTQTTLARLGRRLGPTRLVLILLLNLIPVGGVLFLGWQAAQILLLYWVENVIVGALALSRILTAQGVLAPPPGQKPDSRAATGCFFILHYGVFTLVHGVFTVILAVRLAGDATTMWTQTLGDGAFHVMVLAAAAFQVVAMIRDWWMSGLWRRSSPIEEMFRPYGRIVVMHVTVLGAAWAMDSLGAPAWAVLILCLAKAALEVVVTAFITPEEFR